MTQKRYKSVLCGLLLLAIAIHLEQHHVEEKHPRIYLQTRRQRKYWQKKARHESA
ncbi:hypothetical protein [Pseudanabaena sp. SR411]|uniref:hypothetical protein n=1 Tax=Pseudanabaena sp. SR411 TaxID=1980935 RepID=UPI0015960F85|nr:hypothetical protein [Pseudanabaena sp. SR411]